MQYESISPGPGSYNTVRGGFSENEKIPIILKSRIKYFYADDIKRQEDIPSSHSYNPDFKLRKNNRYNSITFGKGIKHFQIDCKEVLF